jgi:3',5'-cyclic AMP phosphodiesterase CpdA
MSLKHEITILHLSDLQFGKYHRFGRLGNTQDPNEPYKSLLVRLTDDLETLKNEPGIRPDLVVITGDIAEWGRPNEFDDALLFLKELSQHLQISLQQVLVVPGNHDIDRSLCKPKNWLQRVPG